MDLLDFKSKLELFLKEYDCMIDIQKSNCDLVNQYSRIVFSSEGECFSLEIDRIEDEEPSSDSSDDNYSSSTVPKKMQLIYDFTREPPRAESYREIELNM